MHFVDIIRQIIGTTFAEHAGYNQVAEVNNIIILYPQTHSSTLNPNGCFDWYVFFTKWCDCSVSQHYFVLTVTGGAVLLQLMVIFYFLVFRTPFVLGICMSFLASRLGLQMAAIKAMVDRLTG